MNLSEEIRGEAAYLQKYHKSPGFAVLDEWANRVDELENMAMYLAYECAKTHGGTIDEWTILARDCIGSTYWRDTVAAIENARAKIEESAR